MDNGDYDTSILSSGSKLSETLVVPAAMTGDEPFEYYGTSRAWSPGWVNRYTTESVENLMSFNAIPYAHHVSPTPLLIVHGRNDKYCLPKYAQQVYEQAGEPKKIYGWILLTILTSMIMKIMLFLR